MNSSIQVNHHRWEEVPPEVLALRKQVFIEEQNVPVELEYDELDDIATHFSAAIQGPSPTNDEEKKVIACARLYPSKSDETQGIIGRMAVSPSYRKQGIAKQTLYEIIKFGLSHYKFETFKLSAQVYAIPFYEQLGFIPHGETFIDAGIDHKDMILFSPRTLVNFKESKSNLAQTPFKYGKDDTTWHFEHLNDLRQLLKTALIQTGNKLEIFSPNLEAELYNDKNIARLISTAARQNPQAEIRILVSDERSLINSHHELVTLSQRLSSKVHIKICSDHYPTPTSTFVLCDRYSIIYRKNHESHEGFANFKASGRVRVLRDHFDSMWKHAHKSREFNTFGL